MGTLSWEDKLTHQVTKLINDGANKQCNKEVMEGD